MIGSAGGITSLVSFPALLAVGISPLTASVTNIVACVAILPGSALASRSELRGKTRWLSRPVLVAMAGGAAGASLLLSTPATVFARIVPFLLMIAALSLIAQPRISSWRTSRGARSDRVALFGGVFGTSLYNGYFGAGAGIMTLAIVLLTVDEHVARANAIKNVLVGAATTVSAAAFVLFSSVTWLAAGALASGMFVGSTIGPVIARRTSGGVLRVGASMIGIALAIRLWVAPL